MGDFTSAELGVAQPGLTLPAVLWFGSGLLIPDDASAAVTGAAWGATVATSPRSAQVAPGAPSAGVSSSPERATVTADQDSAEVT